MTIQFPASPANNQIYFDTTTGNRYKWSSVHQSWLYTANNVIGAAAGIEDTQIIYQDGGGVAGSNGLTFNTTANTLTANTINAYSMRVTGNLYIGSNTVVISNNSISADMIDATVVMVGGSVVPTGDQSNAMYVVANAAFGHSNSTLTHSQAVYGAVNSAFGVVNASFGSTNTVGGYANTAGSLANQAGVIANAAYSVANASFDLANTTYASVNSAFGVINAAFSQSNSEFAVINAAFGSANTVGGYANTAGSLANQAGVIANAAFGHSNTTYGAVNSAFAVINSAYTSVNAGYVVANAGFDLANTKVSKSGDTITGTLNIVGDLIISGNTRQINANTMSVSDPLIYLAANNYSSDIVDIGFIANYVNTAGANVHTGLYREHENKEYYLFQGYDREPINNHLGAMSNNMTLSVLNADIRTSNLNLGGANAIVWIKSAYDTVNAAYTSSNSDYAVSNAAFGVANAAYGQVNTLATSANAYAATVGTSTNNYTSATYSTLTQFGSVFGVANAAFGAANTKVATVTGTAGRITSSGTTGITLDLATAGLGAATYSSGISALTVDAYGRVTSVTGSAGYLTGITSGQVTTALGYTPYNSTNPNGYITSSSLSPYALLSGATFSGDVRSYRAAASTTGVYYFSQSGDYYLYWDSSAFYFNGGYLQATGSMRSPIFYDSNDTGYYTNPNDFSRMYGININYLRGSRQINSVYNSSNTLLATPTGIEFDSGSAFIHFTNGNAIAPFATYRSSGDLPAPYGIGWGNGGESSGIFQRYSSGGSFGEMIFYIGNDGAGSFAFRRGTWEGTAQQPSGSNQYDYLLANIDWSGNLIGTGSVRGPIFYDYNDTGYYTDPNGTSNLWRLNVNGSSISGSGYTRLVNGMIIQWGNQSVCANCRNTYNFPIAFPNGCYGFSASGDWSDANGWQVCGGTPISASQFVLTCVIEASRQVYWMAIGY